MTRFVAAALLFASSLVAAQEIGREIPAEQTPPASSSSSSSSSYDNQYQTPATPSSSLAAPPRAPGPRRGAFGVRAQLGGSAAGIGAPTVGFVFLASEAVGITFDLGMGVTDKGAFGFGFAAGLDVHPGSITKPVRPVFSIGAGFGKTVSTQADDFVMDVKLGGGAEYWFSDNFSVGGRVLIDVPIDLSSSKSGFQIVTLTPGVGGTFYF